MRHLRDRCAPHDIGTARDEEVGIGFHVHLQ